MEMGLREGGGSITLAHGLGPAGSAKRSLTLQRSNTLLVDHVTRAQGSSMHDLQVFSAEYQCFAMPKHHMPNCGVPANVAFQAIEDLRQLDHNPRLNLASFVTTWMEPQAEKLITDSLNVNFVDMDEYPSCTDIHNRCVSMLANLYHSPAKHDDLTGACAIGSSEAIMLAGLAMKKKWMARRKAAGLPYDKPNMVMCASVQCCWEKFCRYFDVDEKLVVLEEGRYCITPELAREQIDENTIGVVGILGSTYNGEFEDIAGLDAMVTEVNAATGWAVPIHVDAASGGFIAPFLYPELAWDFRLDNVKSINVSGHKYGLVYAGIGWVLWREREDLPEDLIFHLNYLGTDQISVTLNFSRGASHILAQYYQFLRLGMDGYTRIMKNLDTIAKRLAKGIMATGEFELLSKEVGVPLVAFRFKKRTLPDGKVEPRAYNEFDLSDRLKEHGWVVPAYTMAADAKDVTLLRCVIRMDHSMTIIEKLIMNIQDAVKILAASEQRSHEFEVMKAKYHRHGRTSGNNCS